MYIFNINIENMKVSKKEILSIKPNMSKSFKLNSYKECLSARAYAYQLCKSDPRPGVNRYSVSIDNKTNTITIAALRV